MFGTSFFNTFVAAWLALAAAVVATLWFVTAPYGRHSRRGWGPTLPASLAWRVMEAPAALVFAAFFVVGQNHRGAVAWVFLLTWEAHYVHRAFVYPWMAREADRRMPAGIMCMALLFNTVNTSINGHWLFGLSAGYATSWLADPRFVAGSVLFVAGFGVNRWSDTVLRGLRTTHDAHYGIPQGGLYRWVSSPNYLGEMVPPRPRLRRLDRSQLGPASARQPALVPADLPGLSEGAQGAGAGGVVRACFRRW